MSRVAINCDLIHPVGEVIFNALSTFDPNVQWPGTTWVRLKACGLFGVDEDDSKYSQAGTYVGENEHTLIVAELASHSHGHAGGGFLVTDVNQPIKGLGSGNLWVEGVGSVSSTDGAGDNQPHNNVQRSYLGYYWLRTA